MLRPEDTLLSKIESAAMIGLLGWNLMTTQRLSLEVAVISSKLQTLEAFIPDSYTTKEAISDGKVVEQRIKRLEEWNQNISERLRSLEEAARNGTKK